MLLIGQNWQGRWHNHFGARISTQPDVLKTSGGQLCLRKEISTVEEQRSHDQPPDAFPVDDAKLFPLGQQEAERPRHALPQAQTCRARSLQYQL